MAPRRALREGRLCSSSLKRFDAIVVGSGISGGWAAKELTERGLRVLLLERGKNVEHQKDYPNARKAPWEYPHRGGRTRAMVDAYPVLQRDYPLNEKNLDWWVNEQESPYTEVEALRLVSRLSRRRPLAHVGPPELPAGAISISRRTRRKASPIDWPIRYADLAPWYDHVEKHAGICRLDRRPAAAARRPVPAGDAAQLRGGDDRRAAREAVRRTPPPHSRPHRQPHAPAAGPRPLPVPQRLLARAARRARTSARSRRRCRPRWRPGG